MQFGQNLCTYPCTENISHGTEAGYCRSSGNLLVAVHETSSGRCIAIQAHMGVATGTIATGKFLVATGPTLSTYGRDRDRGGPDSPTIFAQQQRPIITGPSGNTN
eukprot:702070-Rhodomonas_salina.1